MMTQRSKVRCTCPGLLSSNLTRARRRILHSLDPMTRGYLLTNAFLYFALAILCTVKHQETSKGSGYVSLSPGGHSEYLVIYGGLQLGLAGFFAYCAKDPRLYHPGVLFALLLYGPIVLYRAITLLMYRPVSVVTWGTAALELILLVWGFITWRSVSAHTSVA